MRLSVRSEYACLALAELASHYEKGLLKIEDIATKHEIPQKYLEQILLQLKRSGFLSSRRGADGGYKLSRPAAQIRLADVIRTLDGPIAPVNSVSTYFFEHTPVERLPKLKAVFQDIRDYSSRKLENTSVADISS